MLIPRHSVRRGELQERYRSPTLVHELLARNRAIAADPVERRIQDYDFFVEKSPTVLSSDVCGVAVGPSYRGIDHQVQCRGPRG